MRRRLRESFEQLRAEADRLSLLFEQLQEGVVAVDRRLEVVFANPSAREIIGDNLGARGASLPTSWSGLSLREIAQALFRADAVVAEARTDTADGSRTISLVGSPLGAPISSCSCSRTSPRRNGVSEPSESSSRTRRTNCERRSVQSSSAVEALRAGASEHPADRDAFIELIERQATRLARLTRSLLILARAESRDELVRLEPVKLRPPARRDRGLARAASRCRSGGRLLRKPRRAGAARSRRAGDLQPRRQRAQVHVQRSRRPLGTPGRRACRRRGDRHGPGDRGRRSADESSIASRAARTVAGTASG